MKTIIIYCTQTGFTKKYADWLAEEIGCDAVPFDERNKADLDGIDLLVFCSWFHAASIKGSKWLKEAMRHHPSLKAIVLATGASPMPGTGFTTEEEIEEAFGRSFPKDEYPNLPHFYCHGGFDFEKLGMPDKIAMRMFFRVNGKKAEDDPKLQEMLDVMKAGFDGTKREYLTPAIEYIRDLEQQHAS